MDNGIITQMNHTSMNNLQHKQLELSTMIFQSSQDYYKIRNFNEWKREESKIGTRSLIFTQNYTPSSESSFKNFSTTAWHLLFVQNSFLPVVGGISSILDIIIYIENNLLILHYIIV